ncbi:MAG: SusC/RagA family TonB-linked outer membrane protein, partial [Syntrophomonadaceae bacterium]|nr:SusC/RagA family TonB-linked outer membrane protein [Syntrophomonadaceae bacterium]
NGILKVDKRNDFNSNIDLKKYAIRSNININIFKSTEAVIRVHGTFDDYSGPIPGGTSLYRSVLNVSPVRFPAYYETPETGVYSPHHILFGNFEGDQYYNPYAEMVRGYRQESKAVIMAQLELNQDLSMVAEGLTGRLMGNTIRNSAFDVSRQYNPFYYQLYGYNRLTGEYYLEQLNPESGTEFLNYSPGYKEVNSSFYGEGQLLYNRTFERHGISGMLVGIIRNSITGNASTLSSSLPQRNLGLSGRFTYDYDLKYFAEFNFGYNGSEKFDKSHRWGFFPSIGVGWLISKEPFWQGWVSDMVSNFKVRVSHGLVGNDAIGDQRFFYLSDVQLGAGEAFRTGYNMDYIKNGVVTNSYSNPNIGWEIAKMTNLGIELGLFDGKLDVNADIYKQIRTNILQPRADIPISMGLWATPLVNVGKAESQGIDLAIDYNHVISNDLWITGRGNFTYATGKFKYYEETDFSEIAPWKSRVGNSLSQQWGYVAERLFIDDADIANSARQDFGEYLPGDLKYKDINNDMVINELDMVPIGYPTTPVLNYGFGFSIGYKDFDMSFFLQGSGKSSFWIDQSALSPFRRYTSGGKYYETGLAKFIAEDYWSETTQNPDAKWPRLSSTLISNNLQRSTYNKRDGNFLRLKSVELGYNLPANICKTIKLKSCRFYISGTNLLLFSDFKLWDVEMGSNGLGYPIQRVFNLGINVSL